MDATIDNVKPLVVAAKDEASYVQVTFRCPTTGFEVSAEGSWAGDGLVQSQAKQAKRTLFSSVRNSVAAQVRRAAGSGMAASIGGTAAANLVQYAGNDGRQTTSHSKRDRDQAVLAAFARVADRFRWEDGARRWVAASAAEVETSAFSDQLAAHPVTEAYDRELLSRLLAALVAADGSIDDDERASFAALAPGADLDALVSRRAPSGVDFEEARLGPTRETLLLLGWAVALSDESLDVAEAELLATAAKGLAITQPRAAELREIAQRHLVEEAITVLAQQGAALDEIRDEVEKLGANIGLGAEEAARVVIRWSKRAR